jgi:uncharacterized membrane protein
MSETRREKEMREEKIAWESKHIFDLNLPKSICIDTYRTFIPNTNQYILVRESSVDLLKWLLCEIFQGTCNHS